MVSVASQLIEEVTAHAQRDNLEDAQEICTDGTYFPNNLCTCLCSSIGRPYCTCSFIWYVFHAFMQAVWRLEDVFQHILQPASYAQDHIMTIMKGLEPITNKLSRHNRIAGMLK